MALFHLCHHSGKPSDTHGTTEDYSPSLEDLRLMMPSPVKTGDLIYLHGKMYPKKYTKPDEFGLPPEARSEDLNEQVRALFVEH